MEQMVATYNTGKTPGDDGETTQMPRLKSGVLTRAALAVVPVANDDPLDALCLVVARNVGHGIPLAVGNILDLVGLAVCLVDGADKHVVGDVVKVTAVFQPRAGHCCGDEQSVP